MPASSHVARHPVTIVLSAVLALCVGQTPGRAEPEPETALAKLAATMEPGQWKELKTEGLSADLTLVTQRKLSILGWGDDARWDSHTRQFLFMGFRHNLKFIAYAEKDNAWREIPTFEWPLKSTFGHPYHNNALDRERGIFFHRLAGQGLVENSGKLIYAFDTRKEEWTRLPPCPFKSNGPGWAIEYFPEMNAILFPYSGSVYKLDMESRQWTVMLKGLTFGLHPVIRHNAKHGVVFLGGGNNRGKHLYRIDADGKAERMAEPPVGIHVNNTKMVEDTATGDFIVQTGEHFHAYCIARDLWAPLDDPAMRPPSRDNSLICAPIPEYGVSMWMAAPRYQAGRAWLFKYRRPAALEENKRSSQP